MSGKASRDKGARAEREFIRDVYENLGVKLSRNYKQWGESQEGDTDPLGPYLPEIKAQAAFTPRPWWAQSWRQANKRGLLPLLAIKVERKGWLYVVPQREVITCTHNWREGYEYTETLQAPGLWLRLREHGLGQ